MDKTSEQTLKHMESILDLLITNAEKLKEISLQVVSKDQLGPLQKTQDELVKNLKEVEAFFQETFHATQGKETHTQKRITEKLAYFQKLNANFIENLKSSHGIIRFEPKKMP